MCCEETAVEITSDTHPHPPQIISQPREHLMQQMLLT